MQQSNFALHDEPETKMTHIHCDGRIDPLSGEPKMLVLFRNFPRRAQHQFIQLAIDEMGLDGEAERSADTFLAHTAWQIENGDGDLASELYPQGCTHRQTWLHHKVACADELIRLERRLSSWTLMFIPRTRMAAPHPFGSGEDAS